jgi:hypothetical protein
MKLFPKEFVAGIFSASNKTLFVCNRGELLLILRYRRIVGWRPNFCRTGYGN